MEIGLKRIRRMKKSRTQVNIVAGSYKTPLSWIHLELARTSAKIVVCQKPFMKILTQEGNF